MLEQIVPRSATELGYSKRSVFVKNITIKSFWTFDLDVEYGLELPFFVKEGFIQREQVHQQAHNNVTIFWPSVSRGQFSIATEKLQTQE